MKAEKIFKLAKGFRGRAKNTIKTARNRVEKALQYMYRDRKNKKREFRELWIQRINAGTREHGVRPVPLFLFLHFSLFLFYKAEKVKSWWAKTREGDIHPATV